MTTQTVTRTAVMQDGTFDYDASELELLAERWADHYELVLGEAAIPPEFFKDSLPGTKYVEAENDTAFMFYRREILTIPDHTDALFKRYSIPLRKAKNELKNDGLSISCKEKLESFFSEGPFDEKFYLRSKLHDGDISIQRITIPHMDTPYGLHFQGAFSEAKLSAVASAGRLGAELYFPLKRRREEPRDNYPYIHRRVNKGELNDVEEVMCLLF